MSEKPTGFRKEFAKGLSKTINALGEICMFVALMASFGVTATIDVITSPIAIIISLITDKSYIFFFSNTLHENLFNEEVEEEF